MYLISLSEFSQKKFFLNQLYFMFLSAFAEKFFQSPAALINHLKIRTISILSVSFLNCSSFF